MLVLDASSVIHAWDNYPPEQFPGLWNWFGSQIALKAVCIPFAAYKEVRDKNPECADWLDRNEVDVVTPSNAIVHIAGSIKASLGIRNDQYGTGVGESDIFIIATAKALSYELVSNESKQNTLPADMRKYKIPAVCALLKPQVGHLDFLGLIKRSKATF